VENNDNTSRYLNFKMIEIKNKTASGAGDRGAWLEIVRRQVGSLRFGLVQIVVHDSQVTQIEKTERVRLDKTRAQTI
jgi:hypothetical protein